MLIVLASGVFNFGFGSLLNLFSGAYNTTPMRLNVKAKAFENTQGFNITQMLFALPKLVLPIIIFYIFNLLIDFNAGIIALSMVGVLGFFMKNYLLRQVEKIYQAKKYETLAAFNKNKI
jgi:hypothetical protein